MWEGEGKKEGTVDEKCDLKTLFVKVRLVFGSERKRTKREKKNLWVLFLSEICAAFLIVSPKLKPK